jgi:hypothetical protein
MRSESLRALFVCVGLLVVPSGAGASSSQGPANTDSERVVI